jgi:hypothetical protein
MQKSDNSVLGTSPSLLPDTNAVVDVVLSSNGSVSVNDPDIRMSPGNVQITWQISSTSIPGTTFPATGGITFVPNAEQPDVWPNAQPAYNQATGTYQVSYMNRLSRGESAVTYNYAISVMNNGQTFNNPDPDVTNDPPG